MHRFSVRRAVAVALLLPATAAAQQAPLTFDQPSTAPAQATANTESAQIDYSQPPQQGPAATVAPQAMDPAGGQATAPPQANAAAAAPAAAPFQLTEQETQYVAQTLQVWEAESAKINTFNANFDRLEYDKVWGPPNKHMIESTGVLSYSKPDKGSFKIDKISRWTKADPKNMAPDAPGEYVEQKEEVGERWVCDGKAIYEYENRLKQLRVTSIPEPMRGQAIVDGPLPFLFGAEAKKLMDRYWIRPLAHPTDIVLEAFPKRQADAVNYDAVQVMLDPKDMHPKAIKVIMPGGQQEHVYVFQPPTINGQIEKWFGSLFSAPRTPFGWTKVVMNEAEAQAANPAAPMQR
jgi:TIGR03009 family protein